ncbi:uncharacterized protein [Physcomitrium patens]|uniref:uncharacterized protein n=1 Tax=Physcomitrium patens TaxID=3218 RepID=UPI003CCCFA8B
MGGPREMYSACIPTFEQLLRPIHRPTGETPANWVQADLAHGTEELESPVTSMVALDRRAWASCVNAYVCMTGGPLSSPIIAYRADEPFHSRKTQRHGSRPTFVELFRKSPRYTLMSRTLGAKNFSISQRERCAAW